MILVGLMSGTSLDGISAAVVRFAHNGSRVSAETLAFDVAPYGVEQRDRLARALVAGTPEEYCRLNFDVGEWFAVAALQVMSQAGVARADIAAIASHGQTVWHVPGHSTWQTGGEDCPLRRGRLGPVNLRSASWLIAQRLQI